MHYEHEENPQQTELQKWSQAPPQGRAACAVFYLAKMQARAKKWDEALTTLEGYAEKYPGEPLIAEAGLLRGICSSWMASWRPRSAPTTRRCAPRKTASCWAASSSHPLWRISSRANSSLPRLFPQRRAAHLQAEADRAFNSALSWLNQGNYEKFMDVQELSARFPESDARKQLVLEERTFAGARR